ncbi:tRNA (N6-threonylcarbamoyladenosine(37)-N6)-methyltransferase TrmO [Maridesulfovibrio bastinii]|uniref:tRNA (N6-threonylcarbamoyladenosine(37)-N6)-methyltransferase TrmO n=1 Tax=Maridesulfovibrio bastinii TaxID=47157 RepID=UPI00040258F5|nr:tRNA (N6-threonylcarbamoyladenosine(37)-N6)-methyltransferase TrmO [Maridesulfovibrio bastinii]
MEITLSPIAYINSTLNDKKECPKQGHEGGIEAQVIIEPEYLDAMKGLKEGSEIILLTWLHKADRTCLEVHPRGDSSRPKRGVFATRSPDRPNPIGVHKVTIKKITENTLTVYPLETLDGTPIVDIKVAMRK